MGGGGGTLLLALLSFLLAGGNYPVALLYGIGLLGGILLSFRKKPRMAAPLIVALIVFLAGFFISVLAPGNAARAQFFIGASLGPVRAIVYALLGVPKRMGGQFFRHRGIILTLLLLWTPFCIYAQWKPTFRYRLPWLLPILSWLILGAMYTPPFYATGTGGADRLWNAVAFMFDLLLMANLFYFIGWFRQRFDQAYTKLYEGMLRMKRMAVPYIVFCVVGVLLVSGIGPNVLLERERATSIQAIVEIYDGRAAQYAFERDMILEEIEASGEEGCITISRPHWTNSKLLLSGDLVGVPGPTLAEWYGKDQISFMPEP